jgi:putative oxygen-independent coproporphyrinogen III oxidase
MTAALANKVRPPPHPTQDVGFGVYVHWPFCLSKCPYCDFNSHVRQAPPDQARYVAGFRNEIRYMAAIAPGRTVTSIFFGGGTPSLMAPQTVGAILDEISGRWPIDPRVEVTLEANPTSVEATRFRGYRAAGVNRVSLGVQALNDADLRLLGRMHTADEAMGAVALAASVFGRFSFDVIYGRPGQSPSDWRAELLGVVDAAGDHLSLYQLTIEPGTVFDTLHQAGKLRLPDADLARELYDVTREVTSDRGFPAYEVSNHARSGAECRHNLIYWRYGEYAGVGPGAHGRLVVPRGRLALSTEARPEAWLGRASARGHGVVEHECLTPEQEGDEFLLMGLRLTEGIDPARYAELAGKTLAKERVADLHDLGLIETSGGRLRATSDGVLVLNAVVADLAG